MTLRGVSSDRGSSNYAVTACLPASNRSGKTLIMRRAPVKSLHFPDPPPRMARAASGRSKQLRNMIQAASAKAPQAQPETSDDFWD